MLLDSFAGRAAIAIHNARLYQEKSALYDVSRAITSSGRLEEVLDKIWHAMRPLIPAESALLFRWDPEAGELSLGGSFGYDKVFLKEQRFTFRQREGYPGWVAATRQSLLISDVAVRPDFPPKYPEMNNGKPLGSFAGVPLVVHDQFGRGLRLDQHHAASCSRNICACWKPWPSRSPITVEQARLFEETEFRAEEKTRLAGKLERRNQQLAAISLVTAAMRSKDDPETVLRLALTGVTGTAGLQLTPRFLL